MSHEHIVSHLLNEVELEGDGDVTVTPMWGIPYRITLRKTAKGMTVSASFALDVRSHWAYRMPTMRYGVPASYGEQARAISVARFVDKVHRLATDQQMLALRALREQVYEFAKTRCLIGFAAMNRPHTFCNMSQDDCRFWLVFLTLLPPLTKLLTYSGQASKSL